MVYYREKSYQNLSNIRNTSQKTLRFVTNGAIRWEKERIMTDLSEQISNQWEMYDF